MTNSLLSGVRVLDLSRLLPGPFCTLYLAQLGAEVIKIEEPQGGDYARTMSPDLFALVNRGKKSVTLDLRKTEDVKQLHRLVETAEVLIESFRPGVMDKLGCGYETLKKINPKLVYAALTGYGQTGPYRDRAGHDMNYLGYAGVLDQNGPANGAPTQSNLQIADLAGGALTCAIGILAAVIGARASGEGAFVDVGMMDGSLALQVLSFAAIRALGRSQPRGQDMLSGALPNYSHYECADGKYIALGALEFKFWSNFCLAVNRPDLIKKPLSPGKGGEATRAEVVAIFKSKTRDEWEVLLIAHDACASAILTPDEVLDNVQVRARGLVQNLNGKPAPAMPIQFPGITLAEAAPAPKLGADTAAVLKSL
ncbi:MAG: CaiB/BaiF CoA transferase family protein, partial [Stenotrophobium sp.]